MSTETLQKPQTFSKLFKVQTLDYEQHMVYGIASTDALDSQNEVVDPNAIKAALPEYLTRGTMRYMHQEFAPDGTPIIDAVGKVIKAEVDDQGRTHIWAKVLDPLCWEKIKAGIIRSFSIAGDVLNSVPKTIGNKIVNVITEMKLSEITLCDDGANPEAKILMFKMNTNSSAVGKKGNDMPKTIKKPAPVAENDTVLADLQKATATVQKARARKAQPVKTVAKAATPDKIIDNLLDQHNDLVKAGNGDAADMITDAIQLLQAAWGDQSADVSGGDGDMDDGMVDPTAGVGPQDMPGVDESPDDLEDMDGDDGSVMMADGVDDDPSDISVDDDGVPLPDANKRKRKADSVDGGADNEPYGEESNPDLEMGMDGTVMSDVTDNVTSDSQVDSNQPDTKDPVAIKSRRNPKAEAVRAKYSGSGFLPSESARFQKAMFTELQKFALNTSEIIAELAETVTKLNRRIEKLESRPRVGGPVLTAVTERGVTKGAGFGGGDDGLESQIKDLEAKIAKMTNPQQKAEAGRELTLMQLRQTLANPSNAFHKSREAEQQADQNRRNAYGFRG